jgi:hypothetical protein
MINRDRKKALWVTMPNDQDYNIGDIKGSVVEIVQDAVIHAFELGYLAHSMQTNPMYIPIKVFNEESK